MNIKTLALYFSSTLLAFLISLSLFKSDGSEDKSPQLHSFQVSLLEKLKDIEVRLGKIENRIGAIVELNSERSKNRTDSIPPPFGAKNSKPTRDERVQPQSNHPVFPSGQNDQPTNWLSPKRWMASLPEDKRDRVKLIIREEAKSLSKKMDALSEDDELVEDKVRSLVEENRNNLKARMRELLTDKEYQGFLETLPKPLVPFSESLPGPPGQ